MHLTGLGTVTGQMTMTSSDQGDIEPADMQHSMIHAVLLQVLQWILCLPDIFTCVSVLAFC